jgi:hypothetical protein
MFPLVCWSAADATAGMQDAIISADTELLMILLILDLFTKITPLILSASYLQHNPELISVIPRPYIYISTYIILIFVLLSSIFLP